MSDVDWESALTGAVNGLRATKPSPLLPLLAAFAGGGDVTEETFLAFLTANNQVTSTALREFALTLADWDFADQPGWDGDTGARTIGRRRRVYELLRLSDDASRHLDTIAAVSTEEPVVISTKWTPWYDEQRRKQWAFYWPHYKNYLLEERGWPGESVAALDLATSDVIQRISDPMAKDQYQSKGLVVGYVQSGKTANFTGVIAKAIDAGYRLIIVMTGTIELLRSQTQRRLDRELVGVENLTRGIDSESAEEFDYAADGEWRQDGAFIKHGKDFDTQGHPIIERMTLLNDDYRRLKQGLTRMKLFYRDKAKPFYDPANLRSAEVRLLVVKKNSTVLEKLAKDLMPLKDGLQELPALIIDDESDLASVNTKNLNPKRRRSTAAEAVPEAKKAERTAINKAIVHLLRTLPRAQLVMYTATPFANFFVDPDDAADIFPKNFIVALERPHGYMGIEEFHDVEWNSEEDKNDPARSNERAFVRPVGPPPDPSHKDEGAGDDELQRESELQRAIDSFVLSGAIKLYRQEQGAPRFRHHTMLIHEAMQKTNHSELRKLAERIWKDGEADGPERLRDLWEKDYRPVCLARAGTEAVPESFDDLYAFIGDAKALITSQKSPVIVVNSDAALEQQALDFDRNDVWRILVGGAKLSRGFTVEGLTVSYYTRKALQGDTLMQAGRWFGFRPHYRDLVRLFIRRDPEDALNRIDLYEAFEGLMRDEKSFRESLRDYAVIGEDGTALEPWQVPPIVAQHLPYLKPTSPNKMFNAVINTMGEGGRLKDRYGLPPVTDTGSKKANYDLIVPWLATAKQQAPTSFTSSRSRVGAEETNKFEAHVVEVPAAEFMAVLKQLQWHEDFRKVIDPVINFFDGLVNRGQIKDAVIAWPRLNLKRTPQEYRLPGIGMGQVISRDRRPTPRIDFPGSDPKHRDALERVAGVTKTKEDGSELKDPAADALHRPHRAGMLIYLAHDMPVRGERPDPDAELDPGNLAVLPSLVAPASATSPGKSVIEWTVRGTRGQATAPQS